MGGVGGGVGWGDIGPMIRGQGGTFPGGYILNHARSSVHINGYYYIRNEDIMSSIAPLDSVMLIC